MLTLKCPNCHSEYLLAPEQLANSQNKKVKCSHCQHIWTATTSKQPCPLSRKICKATILGILLALLYIFLDLFYPNILSDLTQASLQQFQNLRAYLGLVL